MPLWGRNATGMPQAFGVWRLGFGVPENRDF